eukprot:11205069-Karenia_brevis.AAC.1
MPVPPTEGPQSPSRGISLAPNEKVAILKPKSKAKAHAKAKSRSPVPTRPRDEWIQHHTMAQRTTGNEW